MDTASKKRRENIAEYILYMWQLEDLLRADNLDIDKINEHLVAPLNFDDARKKETLEWYESLIDMMRREGVEKSGHLAINRNILSSLVELHQALLADPRFGEYTKEFYKALPVIVELRAKSGEEKAGEIETCFNALYGMLLLRLSGREVSPATTEAVTAISKFISLLASYFHKNEKEDIFRKED